MNALNSIALLVFGTFASEDLTCITAGQLVAGGQMNSVVAVGGCFAGIFIGDVGLWLIGRSFGTRVARLPWIASRLPAHRLDQLGDWLDRHALRAIAASRFLPGTRVPLYVAAGALGTSGWRFIAGAMLAALVWTPIVVLLAATLGGEVARRFLGTGWIAFILAGVACFALMRLIRALSSEIGRAKLVARMSRLWRWEFWPAWLFYAPLVPWIAWLSLRHRSFTTITAANPGIPHGGFVGESKFQILSRLRHPCVSPSALIDPDLAQLDEVMRQRNWSFPLILKPDVGQRGAGVKFVHTRDESAAYLETSPQAILVQPYHPGPFEAGVFYYRLPGEARGRIFSITDKHFAELVGDGVATFEQLVWRHPRYRMQARTFLARHAHQRDRVLAANERVPLVVAGNHCQGTLFSDGSHLLTPELEHTIDRIARTFDGFHFGRFDVRYSDIEAFKRGQDLCVIELNGITSESTNVYDPSRSLICAWATLMRQWSILFRIGHANRQRGHRPSRLRLLVRDISRHYGDVRPGTLSD